MMSKLWPHRHIIPSRVGGQCRQTNYASSKAGLVGFTKVIGKRIGTAQHHRQRHRAGFFTTALTDVLQQEFKEMDQSDALGSIWRTRRYCARSCFFVSDDAAFITGQVLSVDGGMVMQ